MLEIPPVDSAKRAVQVQIVKDVKEKKSMKQWIKTKLDPDKEIRSKPIIVKDKTGRQINGNLEVEDANNNGGITVSANYNSSPYPNTVTLVKFYLTQSQMDAFEADPEHCVIDAGDTTSGIKL